jgi:hypothetical protein
MPSLNTICQDLEGGVMSIAFDEIETWINKTHAKLENGGAQAADLDELAQIISESRKHTRQRLLYLHASTPNIRSQVIGMALHEPVCGSVTEITTRAQEWPYHTIHDAILDGWQVIHFPNQRTDFDDREIDILGYEFILQKLEVYNG